MRFKYLFLSFLILVSFQLTSIENSIVPVIERFEQIENLDAKKYSTSQFAEIKDILSCQEEKLRFATYNTLGYQYERFLPAEYSWKQRLPRIIEMLNEMKPDVLCVQEVFPGTPDQQADLLQSLGDTYTFFAQPSDDGELNGIFYKKERFEMLESRVWFITPEFDPSAISTLTMVHLKDLMTDKTFAVFNVHLTFSNINKREYEVRFAIEQMKYYAKKTAVLFAGDMNLFPNRPDMGKLPFYDGDYIHRLLTRRLFKDSKEVSLLGHVGPISTFTNASEDDVAPFKGLGTPGVMLDHIYVTPDVQVMIHAVQPATVGGKFPSDHMPVIIDFVID